MTNTTLLAITWCAVAVHAVVGLCVWRRVTTLPLLNGATALCVLAYWVPRRVGYIRNGTTWYFSDQLLPLYALGVCVLAGYALAGRHSGGVVQGIVFGLHAVVLVGAAIFFMVFKMDRLI